MSMHKHIHISQKKKYQIMTEEETKQKIKTLFTEEKLKEFLEEVTFGYEYEFVKDVRGYFLTYFQREIKEMVKFIDNNKMNKGG